MEEIINGKLYDTETAQCVGTWGNDRDPNEDHYWSMALYRKRTYEFFLHIDWGTESEFAFYCSNYSWFRREEIIPLTYEAAQEWVKDHLSDHDYRAIFGENIYELDEDEFYVRVPISMSIDTLEEAKYAALRKGITLSAYIDSLIVYHGVLFATEPILRSRERKRRCIIKRKWGKAHDNKRSKTYTSATIRRIQSRSDAHGDRAGTVKPRGSKRARYLY